MKKVIIIIVFSFTFSIIFAVINEKSFKNELKNKNYDTIIESCNYVIERSTDTIEKGYAQFFKAEAIQGKGKKIEALEIIEKILKNKKYKKEKRLYNIAEYLKYSIEIGKDFKEYKEKIIEKSYQFIKEKKYNKAIELLTNLQKYSPYDLDVSEILCKIGMETELNYLTIENSLNLIIMNEGNTKTFFKGVKYYGISGLREQIDSNFEDHPGNPLRRNTGLYIKTMYQIMKALENKNLTKKERRELERLYDIIRKKKIEADRINGDGIL